MGRMGMGKGFKSSSKVVQTASVLKCEQRFKFSKHSAFWGDLRRKYAVNIIFLNQFLTQSMPQHGTEGAKPC